MKVYLPGISGYREQQDWKQIKIYTKVEIGNRSSILISWGEKGKADLPG